jgi:hypothetical protein
MGNLVCDIVLNTLHGDLCLLNSGSFRSGMIHPAGPFTLGTCMTVSVNMCFGKGLSTGHCLAGQLRSLAVCCAADLPCRTCCGLLLAGFVYVCCCVCVGVGAEHLVKLFPFKAAPLRMEVTGQVLCVVAVCSSMEGVGERVVLAWQSVVD